MESNWISTKDRLPEKSGKYNYEHVVCLVVRDRYVTILSWNCEENCWDNESGDDYECDVLDVTHWQPLPSPPKELIP